MTDVRSYSYYEPETCGLKFEAMMKDVEAAPDQSLFLFHGCAHNPTGVDPTPAQWDQASKLCAAKKHRVFFDTAYQGFASGDKERDAYAVRKFVEDGNTVLACQSFAKNFGLYGQRIGALSLVCGDDDEATRVLSQLKSVVRRSYSNPPLHGARIVQTVLEDKDLAALWAEECGTMAARIGEMRGTLRAELEKLGAKRDWSHLTNQVGMFCFTGLTSDEVNKMKADFHIYMTQDGRMNVAGLTTGNVEYVAKAVYTVTEC
jgi:aspartate aminotransferase